MLETLDWEIRTATDEGKAIGISTWSLALALGGILWLLSNQANYSWRQLPPLVHLIIGFSLIYDFLSSLYFTTGPTLPEQEPRRVSSASAAIDPQRRTFVFDLLRRLVLTALVFSGIDTFMSAGLRRGLLIWFGAVLFVYLLVLLMGLLLTEPTADRRPTARIARINRWTSSFSWLATLIATVIFWLPVLRREAAFEAADYRAACLIVVATFLVHLLLGSLQRPAMLPFLVTLRRDLAFGIISPEDATDRARRTLSGLVVDEFLKKEFASHKTLMTLAAETFAKINSFLDVIERDLQVRPERDPEEFLPKYEQLIASGSKLDNNHSHFIGKLEALPDGTTRSELSAEAGTLIATIRERRAQGTTQIARIRATRAATHTPGTETSADTTSVPHTPIR